MDDVLDERGNAELLGKSIGKDKKQRKTTFLSFFGAEDAMQYAEELTRDAIDLLNKYENSDTLTALAEYLLKREN